MWSVIHDHLCGGLSPSMLQHSHRMASSTCKRMVRMLVCMHCDLHQPNVKVLEALLRFPCHCATSQHGNICHHQLSDDEGLCYTQLLRQHYDIAPTSDNSGCVICLWASLSFEPDLSVVQFPHSKMPAMTACMQITVLGMSSLGAMRRPSPSSDFCITHLSCGTTKVSACGC